MKTKTFTFILLAVLLALAATPVYADTAPALPHAFYGAIEVNGSPAPVGTQVEARGEGVQTGVDNNPIEVTVEGEYGGSDGFDPKLVVWGNIAEGATITFYVDGVSTGQTAQWHSGWVTELNMAATVSSSSSGSSESSESDESSGTTPEPPPESTPEPPPEDTEPSPSDSTEPGSEDAAPAPLLPPPPPSGSDGVPVLWLIVGGVVLVGLIVGFAVVRRRAY